MKVIADFHTHSRFAMACSQNITLNGMESAAIEKGISLISTGDFLHGSWLKEISANLEESSGKGLFKLKGSNTGVKFILSGEVCTIFNARDKTLKKIHNCIALPSIDSVKALREVLLKRGILDSDGRPILSMSAAELVGIVFSIDSNALVFPAHAWTPYFGVLGSISGFDSIKDAYEDQEKHIYALETGLSCYDENTEVLTEEGWKKVNEIIYSDRVCTLEPSSNKIEFHKPTKLWKYQYKGKMYKLKTKRVDLLVTPNHKLFYTPFASHNPKKQFYLKEAESLFGKSKSLKKDGIWTGNNIKHFKLPSVKMNYGNRYGSNMLRDKKEKLLPITPWLKFLGFWIAEGHTTKGDEGDYNVVVSNTNKSILLEMKVLLEEMGYNPLLQKSTACPQLRVRDFQLFSYLNKLGKSYDKSIPKEIKTLSKELLSILFEYYIKGDGHRYGRTNKGLSATTNSIKLRDDLQEIALKLGMSAYYKLGAKAGTPLKSLNKSQYKATHGVWVVYFIRKNTHSIVPSNIKKYNYTEAWTDFEGDVYCVTVPNHVMYVRRNGIPIWCGNSDPPMNWCVSELDKYTLLSNSDMHSLPKMGREANVLELEEGFDYKTIISAIHDRDIKRFKGTIEFYPEEGKYHYDGHKNCHFSTAPGSGITACPVCGKKLVVGVLHRVLDLADRELGFRPSNAPSFTYIVPLREILAYALKKTVYSPIIDEEYSKLIEHFGTEFNVLIDANIEEIAQFSSDDVAQAVKNVRENKIHIEPGYAGIFGELDLLGRKKTEKKGGQSMLKPTP